MEFTIITGMSGAGKSQAANILEDAGYYCIDNMPAKLMPEFATLYSSAGNQSAVAFIIDARGENDFNNLFASMKDLEDKGHSFKTVFIECSDEVLVNRYKETRRVHPLSRENNMSIREAIERERDILSDVKERSDIVIDTTKTNLAQLREMIYSAIKEKDSSKIYVSCSSFGFKYGPASEADLVFDVRCFPNPFYIPELKHKTGLDDEVRRFVFESEDTRCFLKKLCDIIDFLLPLYIKEGKRHLSIAIGCTGGKHRSVAIAEALASHVSESGYSSDAFHRDINKE